MSKISGVETVEVFVAVLAFGALIDAFISPVQAIAIALAALVLEMRLGRIRR